MSSDAGEAEVPTDHCLGYESLREERTTTLPVEGSLPEWLSGTFVRNGPGRFEVGERSVEHWFDGLAMLRRFGFGDGEIRYANRFLRTDAFRAAREGRIDAQGFAATPDRGPLERLRSALSLEPTDNANADVARLAGRTVALTESPRVVEFDAESLATRGELVWEDDLPVGHTTPHLRRDPRGGGTVGYLTSFLPRSAYHVFRVPDDEPRREVIARVPVENPAYMHSFALTPEYVVLTEMPFVMPPLRILSSGKPLMRQFDWRPQQMTRFVVLDRDTGEAAAEHRVPPFVVFHHANAYRDGEELVVDLLAFDSPSILNGMYLDRLRNATPETGGGGELRRYRLPLSGGEPTRESLAEELALVRYREDRTGHPYRYVYGQDTRNEGPADGVTKVDTGTGDRTTWRSGGYASEPVFVPAPDGEEDDGVVLVELLLPEQRRSAVVVLDAVEMTELARAPTPHHLPFGFHGQFFADPGA